jgi:hypothetical protein
VQNRFLNLLTILIIFLSASPALAIRLAPSPQQMCASAPCGRAGQVLIQFEAADFTALESHFLAGSEFALLRFTLSGTNLNPSLGPPVLCQSIVGDPSNDLVFSNPSSSFEDVVDLDVLDVEVSDISGNSIPDFTAYITGTSGTQYFEVVITDFDPGEIPVQPTALPWLLVGLDSNNWPIADGESHALWVDVSAFNETSVLEVSLDTFPLTLTYTPGADEIGLFVSCNVPDLGQFGLLAMLAAIAGCGAYLLRHR